MNKSAQVLRAIEVFKKNRTNKLHGAYSTKVDEDYTLSIGISTGIAQCHLDQIMYNITTLFTDEELVELTMKNKQPVHPYVVVIFYV